MKSKYWLNLFFLALVITTAGCSEEPKAPQVVTKIVTQKPDLTDPFRYHKLVEVSPGQYYDVFSWGRGSKTVGSFMILHSDSAAAKYTTTTGDLDGSIVDVYNTDMDADGNPEILIQTKGKDSTNYTTVYAFEYTYGKAQKIPFPKLSKSQAAGYRGDDDFYIKEGQLYREFPIFTGSGPQAKASGQKRQLKYSLQQNYFTVKQLSKDSVKNGTAKPGVNAVAKTPSSDQAATPAKKHAVEKKHKKKKHRHHASEG